MAFGDAGGEIPNESFGLFAIDLESGVIQERFGHHDLLFLATRRVADALCLRKRAEKEIMGSAALLGQVGQSRAADLTRPAVRAVGYILVYR